MIYNKIKNLLYYLLLVVAVSIISCTSNCQKSGSTPEIRGDYLGQAPPGDSLDNWSQPVNMGHEVNSAYPGEWPASVSTVGKYLFFMSDRMGGKSLELLSTENLQLFHNSPQNGNPDIHWISSSVIKKL